MPESRRRGSYENRLGCADQNGVDSHGNATRSLEQFVGGLGGVDVEHNEQVGLARVESSPANGKYRRAFRLMSNVNFARKSLPPELILQARVVPWQVPTVVLLALTRRCADRIRSPVPARPSGRESRESPGRL